jgi:hypothetical protein
MQIMGVADLPAVEIGCAEGNFSRDLLASGVKKLIMVDNWSHIANQTGDGNESENWHQSNFSQAMSKVSAYPDQVEVLKGISWKMAKRVPDNSVGMIYIDACHEYKCVKQDLDAWYSKVVPGGIIAGHDYMNEAYGVKRAVDEFAAAHKLEVILIPENSQTDASFFFIKR